MSRVLTALRQLNLIAPALPEVRPERVKPRLSAYVRKAVLVGAPSDSIPSVEQEVSSEPMVLFQVPRINMPTLLDAPTAPLVASLPQQPNHTEKTADRITEQPTAPTAEKIDKSLDQITAGLLEALAIQPVASLPKVSQPIAAVVRSRELPRTVATEFELALRAKHLEIDEENAFRELAATMRQATKSIAFPMLALASLGDQPESQSAIMRLALRLSEEYGRPSLLIDAAFSTSLLTQVMERERSQGLSEVLSGTCQFRDCLQATSMPNLDFLSVGRTINNAYAFALNSADFASQLRELEDRYAVIMCDVGGLVHPWSVAVAKAADAAYLAVELGGTPMEVAMECIARFRESGGEFRGCVVLGSE